jgi:hypothetical protein
MTSKKGMEEVRFNTYSLVLIGKERMEEIRFNAYSLVLIGKGSYHRQV